MDIRTHARTHPHMDIRTHAHMDIHFVHSGSRDRGRLAAEPVLAAHVGRRHRSSRSAKGTHTDPSALPQWPWTGAMGIILLLPSLWKDIPLNKHHIFAVICDF